MIGALLDPVRAQKKELPVRSSLRVQFSTWIVSYVIFCVQHQATKGSVSACCSVTWVNPSPG